MFIYCARQMKNIHRVWFLFSSGSKKNLFQFRLKEGMTVDMAKQVYWRYRTRFKWYTAPMAYSHWQREITLKHNKRSHIKHYGTHGKCTHVHTTHISYCKSPQHTYTIHSVRFFIPILTICSPLYHSLFSVLDIGI